MSGDFVCGPSGVDPDCPRCAGTGVVCEDHPDSPWSAFHRSVCGPGMPCRSAGPDDTAA